MPPASAASTSASAMTSAAAAAAAAAAQGEAELDSELAPPTSALGPFVKPGETYEAYRTRFWRHQLALTEGTTKGTSDEEDAVNELKLGTGQIPLARIKKVMKGEGDEVKMISAEAPQVFARACEAFIADLTSRAFLVAESHKRRTIQRSDICEAIASDEMYDFLLDTVPDGLLAQGRRSMPGVGAGGHQGRGASGDASLAGVDGGSEGEDEEEEEEEETEEGQEEDELRSDDVPGQGSSLARQGAAEAGQGQAMDESELDRWLEEAMSAQNQERPAA